MRISPDSCKPDLFFLLFEGEKDRPLSRDGRILFFSDASRAASILDQYQDDWHADEIDIEEPLYCADIANLLYVLTSSKADREGTAIDALNLLLDMLPLSPAQPPERFLGVIRRLADHFTFSKEPDVFFREHPDAREEAIDAVLWAVGSIVSIADIV